MNEPHILLVDDDFLVSYALKEHLEQQGYRVTVSNGCQEAKKALRGPSKVDLMILDFLMADGCGTDLFHSMAEESAMQKPRIIMCSGLIDPHNPSWKVLRQRLPYGLQPLIRAYVNKPYTFEEMVPKIRSILDGHSSSDPNEVTSGDFPLPRHRATFTSKERGPA
jgi:DNA-binding response OmpR family regulator